MMTEDPFDLEGKEFIFEYGKVKLLPLDRLRKDEHGNTVATEQKAYRRERVVRCRDCAHAYQRGGGIYCSLFLRWGRNDNPVPLPVEPDGFCAWGSERDGE